MGRWHIDATHLNEEAMEVIMKRRASVPHCVISFFIFSLLCVLALSGGYSKSLAEGNLSAERPPLTYAERIVLIDNGKPLIAWGSLLGKKLFRELSRDGSRNIEACATFLADANYTPQQRAIAIMSMHELGALDYAVFLRRLLSLYQQKLASKEELSLAVVPGYDFSTVLIENFRLSEVQAVLEEIGAQPDIRPATRIAIKRMLSGEAIEDLNNFRRDCCTPRN